MAAFKQMVDRALEILNKPTNIEIVSDEDVMIKS